MPGYQIKLEHIPVAGVADLRIRSLLDRQQFADADGRAAAMGISSASWPLFGLLWPSGQRLATLMAVRPLRPGERILELGCGLALASLVSHRRGADVTASDCHPLTGEFLAHNLWLNGLGAMPYRQGHWGRPHLPDDTSAVQGEFDLIIGSDLLYERDDAGELADFIARHSGPAVEVMIVDPERGNRAPFNRRMAALGFQREETRLDDPAPPAGGYRGRLLHYRRLAS
jgi:predicted nicotinamide N-methyase